MTPPADTAPAAAAVPPPAARTPTAAPMARRPRLGERLSRLAASRLAVPVGIALAALCIGVNEAGFHLLREATASSDAARETRSTAMRLHRLLLQAESAQRGFLLTRRDAYRAPFESTMEEAGRTLARLQGIAQRRPADAQPLRPLIEIAERKATEMREVLRLVDRGDRDAAMALLMTDIGREQMEQLGRLAQAVVDDRTLAEQADALERDRVMHATRVAIDLLVLACLAALFLLVRQVREQERERRAAVAALQAERDKLGDAVDARTAELSTLAHHLQSVREDERSLLARELHDELGGLLTAAKLDLARIRSRLGPDTPPELAERVAHLGRTLDAGIALKRRIIEDLRPSSLDNLGLVPALGILCSEWSARTEVPVETELQEVALPAERALVVYRLVQEALTNIAKYARARHVRLGLGMRDGRVRLRIADDGDGFDPAHATAGHGLAGMRFRLQSVGGTLALRSSPGAGTAIEAELPAS